MCVCIRDCVCVCVLFSNIPTTSLENQCWFVNILATNRFCNKGSDRLTSRLKAKQKKSPVVDLL